MIRIERLSGRSVAARGPLATIQAAARKRPHQEASTRRALSRAGCARSARCPSLGPAWDKGPSTSGERRKASGVVISAPRSVSGVSRRRACLSKSSEVSVQR